MVGFVGFYLLFAYSLLLTHTRDFPVLQNRQRRVIRFYCLPCYCNNSHEKEIKIIRPAINSPPANIMNELKRSFIRSDPSDFICSLLIHFRSRINVIFTFSTIVKVALFTTTILFFVVTIDYMQIHKIASVRFDLLYPYACLLYSIFYILYWVSQYCQHVLFIATIAAQERKRNNRSSDKLPTGRI